MKVLTVFVALALTLAATTVTAHAQDRAAIATRLRTELAMLLKKPATQLPLDRPVIELGVDELTVIEWQMAAEKAFRVYIDDDKLLVPNSKPLAILKTLTITTMAAAVATSKPWPPDKKK